MTDWYKSACGIDHVPEELDTTSSKTTVYQRRNIEKKVYPADPTMEGEDAKEREGYEYEERRFTREEWDNAQINAAIVSFKHDEDIRDAWTEELIEEGVL